VLNRGVVERGDRLLGSVHAAYFRRSFSLIGEWQFGHGSYANGAASPSAAVPYSGFYATAGYFLTGEQIERRTRLYPLRPLVPTKPGQRQGLGAWEVVGRYSELALGDEVFRAGFADPAAWSRSASTTELGVNWYWNEYIKMYFFWLHGRFGDPVLASDGLPRDGADMFWMRFQLYY
jgi:phosphate-selective porin OprO/OprP